MQTFAFIILNFNDFSVIGTFPMGSLVVILYPDYLEENIEWMLN